MYVYDMERLASRMAYGNASPRDVLQLVATLEHAKPILELASALESYPEFMNTPSCQDLYQLIQGAIVPDPPLTMKDGGVFQQGYSQELDELREISEKGKNLSWNWKPENVKRTGVKILKNTDITVVLGYVY